MKRINIQPGEVVDVFSSVGDGEENAVIVRTASMEISRLHVAAGRQIPVYEAQGEIVILCMEGQIEVNSMNKALTLTDGQAVYLRLNEQFSLTAILETSLLLIVVSVSGVISEKLLGTTLP